jgi:hypothetical protein
MKIDDQLAYMLTKPLLGPKAFKLGDKLHLTATEIGLRGHVKMADSNLTSGDIRLDIEEASRSNEGGNNYLLW